jgi:aminopeptidase N
MSRASLLFLSSVIAARAGSTLSSEPGSGFDVVSYEVSLTPDFGRKSVRGRETVRLVSTSTALREIAFPANALTIAEASIGGTRVVPIIRGKALVFPLPRPLPKGKSAALRFRFSGTPARGVTWLENGVYTSYFACDWMVCLQDSPGDKASFALDLTVPKGFTSVSNGLSSSRASASSTTVVHHWRSERPYSPYLYAFAAGRMPLPPRLRANPGLTYIDLTGKSVDVLSGFAETPAMVRFFASKAGVPLPARTYVQLLVPGGEAQEAATHSLIGHETLKRDLANPAGSWIIAHELAHQWWGNLVTSSSWRELWLNEGIATFMTAAWKEQRYGRASYEAELDAARRRVARARDAGFDKPLAWSGAYPNIATRRAIQYSKGALFLDQLRGEIGDDDFWRGLRQFTRTHAGGVVTSADFQTAMETASGRDLRLSFKTWVFG